MALSPSDNEEKATPSCSIFRFENLILPRLLRTSSFRINRRRAFALAVLLAMAQRRRRRSRFWVHPINQQRRAQGDYYHLVQELRLDSERHHQYFRMSVEKFEELLSIIGPELRRQCTTYRASIEPQQRLAVALRRAWLVSVDIAGTDGADEPRARNCPLFEDQSEDAMK
ncbi:hypothetical protein WMY93_002919 [Mugilogobius chulae]|uniref:Uncharacterized protein n=1 Tax=Mugilogobius chulae TaxID=88201 RepID=A0AAW0PV78_9GOBI